MISVRNLRLTLLVKLHDYQFPEEEVTQFIDAYEKENAKRAKLTYKVKQYLPGQGGH